MKTYTTDTAIKHDGVLYKKGTQIELDKKAAQPLLASGAIFDPADVEDDEVETTDETETETTDVEKDEDAEDEDETVDLTTLSKDELLAKAKELGLEVKASAKKDEIIAAIESAEATDEDAEDEDETEL